MAHDTNALEELIVEAIQAEHKEAARRSFWDGVVSVMRHRQLGLEDAITEFRKLAIPRLDAFSAEDAAHLTEEFNIDAQWLRKKFNQMRELVALADLNAGANKKES